MMDRSLSQQSNPSQSKAKATPFYPAKYGAKWLEPTKTTLEASSRMQEKDEILNGKSIIADAEEPLHRRVASVYTKHSWPPKPTYRSYKSVEENKQNKGQSMQGWNDASGGELDVGNGDNNDFKSRRSGQFFDHFQEPTSFQAALSKFNRADQNTVPSYVAKHKQQYYESPADSYVSSSSGYMSFDHPKPYVRPKYLNKNPRTEYLLPESPRDRPQSENSFFDMVKDYNRGDMKRIADQRSPASKTMTKVLGPGLDSTNFHATQTPSKPKSDHSNSSQEHIAVSRQTSNNEVPCAALKCWSLEKNRPRQSFAHYDWQSIIFSFSDVLLATETLKRKNEMTGASKAAALTARLHSVENSPASSFENLPDIKYSNDSETARTNDVIGWCPFFLNEIGGETDNDGLCFDSSQTSSYAQTSTVSVQLMRPENSTHSVTNSPTHAQMLLVNHKGVSVLEKVGIDDDKQLNSVGFMQEYIDAGALYYRKHFFQQDHQNFLGIDEIYGPIAISIKREKLKESNANIKENFWQFRIIFRASELCTLRGSVLEDVIIAQPYSTVRALRMRDVLEYVCPEINFDCLKLSQPTESVQQQLLKIDEQNVTSSYKIGVMYCKKGQTTEEEMYNNEYGSPALEEFLDLLGDRIQLKGFDKFRGGLDVKTNSTGKESYFTTFQNSQIMFHVSPFLPHTPVNVQQLLRKRHIGNDIVTIVFQEAESLPFSPKTIRSHFQHLFVVVRVHLPCSNRTSYRVAISRSQDIPAFGPQIPNDALFPKSETFREFLLTKLLNGERAARSAGKFKAMSMNTRQEYLRDLALHYTTQTGLDTSQKFTRFSLTAASRRVKDRDKFKNKLMPEECSLGALVWRVLLQDCGHPEGLPCMLSISDYMFCLIRESTKTVVFNIPCQAVIGWAEFSNDVMHFYYGRGERISIRASSCASCDWKREVKKRYHPQINSYHVTWIETFSFGCETKSKTLRRNTRGQLGFHINYEGIVMDVEQNGYAHDIGVTQGSRLVEICKVLVVTMTHEEMLDLLRTSDVVAVILIPPLEDGTPRRCSKSLYHISPVLKMIELNADDRNPSPCRPVDGAIHCRSKSDPASKVIKLNKSFDDITRTSSYNLSQNSNQNSIKSQGVVTSAASTPTLRINPLPNKRTANQFIGDSAQRLRPKPYRQSLQETLHYSGSREFGHNHFTTMPLKKSREKLYYEGSGMKHSTSTESGLNSYENVNNNNKSQQVDTFTGFLKPQSLKGLRQTSSATNSTVSTPTANFYPLPSSAFKPASNKETFLPQTKPRHQKKHASNHEQRVTNTSRYPSAVVRKERDRMFAASNGMKHSTSTESGLNYGFSDQDNYDRMHYAPADTYPVPARRKKLSESKPLPNANMEEELRNFVQKSKSQPVRQERRRRKSPPVERRRAPKKESHVHRKLMRSMSDESICGIVQNPRSWNNKKTHRRGLNTKGRRQKPHLPAYKFCHGLTMCQLYTSQDAADLRNPSDYSTENIRRALTPDDLSGAELQYDSNNPGDNEYYSDNDTIHGQLSDPRPATSRSPLFMLETDSSEDAYEPMVRFQPSSDANIRLLKIEEALRSLQTELAKEKKSKRKILIEVERLRKDNQILQQRTVMKHNNISDA